MSSRKDLIFIFNYIKYTLYIPYMLLRKFNSDNIYVNVTESLNLFSGKVS